MYFVLLADHAYKTADVVGVHGSKTVAQQQANGFPEQYPDGSRPIVVTKKELDAMRRTNRQTSRRWDVKA